MNDELIWEIISAAFSDEMEKMAGLPRAVREGGGGAYGAALRRFKQMGQEVARGEKILSMSKADMGQRVKNLYRSKGVDPLAKKRMRLAEVAAAERRGSSFPSRRDVLRSHAWDNTKGGQLRILKNQILYKEIVDAEKKSR